VRLPETPGPSQVRFVEGDPRDAARLADVESCRACHAETHGAWSASPHARASFDNPWYRQAVDAFRAARGAEASAFCAGCHDPVLLTSGRISEAEIAPSAEAVAGITCRVCHGIREVRPDGGGSYTLSTAALHLPDPNLPASVDRHRAEVAPEVLRSSGLCGSCHRGFLEPVMGQAHFLPGVDDLGAWQRSGFAGSRAARLDTPIEPSTCQGCHMEAVQGRDDLAAVDGALRSHRVPGGQTALATADPAQRAAVQATLRRSVRLHVAAIRRGPFEVALPAQGAAVEAGETVALEVVLRNTGVGHRFPGGLRDAQDLRLEVEVQDATGDVVARDDGHGLRAWAVDEDGRHEERHRVETFAAIVADSTIGPRDARAVRYAFEVPEGGPFTVTARLSHRPHPEALADAACEAQRSPRGRAFDALVRSLGRPVLDACAPPPVTVVAEASAVLGGEARSPSFDEAYDLGLALAGQVQERLDEARAPLRAALEAATTDRERAMALAQLGRLAGRQGRADEALDHLAAAEIAWGEAHPAIDRLRGEAYAQVWRWPEAATAYGAAVDAAPEDDALWARLAQAAGSAGDEATALAAALRGLALRPRHEGLLRSQYLGLEEDHPRRADARAAYLAHRVPDRLDGLRRRCADRDPACRSERLPVPMRVLSRTAAPAGRR
jgi:hypothetical protein